MKNKILHSALLLVTLCTIMPAAIPAAAQELAWNVGLSSDRTVIKAQGVNAGTLNGKTVLYLAGINGESEAADQIRNLVISYTALATENRPVNLIAIALANPESETLMFPPAGNAYAENPVAHALWRWIGTHAPDLVVMDTENDFGLAAALQSQDVAGFGSIPVQGMSETTASVDFLRRQTDLAESSARMQRDRRLARTPQQLAQQLSNLYGHDFSTPAYVPGMSLIGRMGLGQMDAVEALLSDYLAGAEIEVTNSSILAGQLVFAEYAEQTGNANALQLVIDAADLAFDEAGNMREAMPMHSEMSDAVFMATPLLVKAGKLTGESRYFDMAARHVAFMRDLLVRDDGLYRHSPLADVAWSRGNAFPALGLALSLSDFPEAHPAYSTLMNAYLQQLEALIPLQDIDGMWHEVVDYPGSFAEITSTAMLGIAIKRGIDRNWLPRDSYQPVLDKAWSAVNIRSSFNNEFVNACTSTGKMPSLDDYLDRPAIFGQDDRAGGMVMNFAIEMVQSR